MTRIVSRSNIILVVLGLVLISILAFLFIMLSKRYYLLFPARIPSTSQILAKKEPQSLWGIVTKYDSSVGVVNATLRSGEDIDIGMDVPRVTVITFNTDENNQLIQDIIIGRGSPHWNTAFCPQDKVRLEYGFDETKEFRLLSITNLGPRPCR
ncbi:MAG: hypothetical protein UW35_C0019G0005 [Candidatus Collierbacteria bacterium GW2011_GWF2_44_15]|uniref:Uncharacterized protein n=3 Tax=Candidatus Collieribacteriota TaxID=1752725 RepID=A0A0G1KEE2_9BACT|nr:MAG: hypothetical protein UU92_C0018G0005 [candidate division WWE3 bacterium GW2011_GWA1_42_12]KKT38730.1 MAG: hypothetical protein UW26_C0013G0003 [Candidatus Collierbacteria bacterium GW2011_GWF1_44_12]KKT46199.1 MAG: hypothetical protein UW35_C0019G0005 [Candidatus Collierbacteria bacterium GW2011_GWF2_44_15]KKT97434.1 MAG: hypothetical protein UW99_C0033G0005 [Candidatus Collierbacteria bacterium GW2011_GWC2_45_15]